MKELQLQQLQGQNFINSSCGNPVKLHLQKDFHLLHLYGRNFTRGVATVAVPSECLFVVSLRSNIRHNKLQWIHHEDQLDLKIKVISINNDAYNLPHMLPKDKKFRILEK